MEAGTLTRGVRRRLAAALVALGTATPAVAQSPEPALFPLPVPEPPPPPVEVYYGTTKVAPLPTRAPVAAASVKPAPELPPQPILLAVARGGSSYVEHARPGGALVETLHAVRDGTRTVSAAAATLLGKVGDRLMAPPPEPRQIVVNYTPPPVQYATPYMPEQSWSSVPATATPAAPPQTIVVVREPAAESRPAPVVAPEPARGMTLSVESMIALGLGAFGMLFGLVALARGSRKSEPPVIIAPPAAPAPVIADGIRLMGIYNAGPVPETAEKFDLGPTYHDEQKQKKQVEEANNQAAVEFILNQNLALLAALNPGTLDEPAPEVDYDGFAIQVDPPTEADAKPAAALA